MDKTSNPSAFPRTSWNSSDCDNVSEGMTLRDYFAGQALIGFIARKHADSMECRVKDSIEQRGNMMSRFSVSKPNVLVSISGREKCTHKI